jgi:hypothetical protein
MSAVRVVDEHLLSPVLVYSGSGGVFQNELVLSTSTGLIKTVDSGNLNLAVDIDALTAQFSKKFVNEIVFNERIPTSDASMGLHFTLASTPTVSSEVQLWLNGQLLTYGEDYTVTDRLIEMLTQPITPGDVLISSYSRPIVMKQYAFGERITVVDGTAALKKLPTSENDVMIFLNGQLLLRGMLPGDNDYSIAGGILTFNATIDSSDVVLATYSYA